MIPATRFKILGRLLLAIGSAAAMLCLCEWLTRSRGLGAIPRAFLDREQYLEEVRRRGDGSELPDLVEGTFVRTPIDDGKGLATPPHRFRLPKPERTYRIFVFGESTTLGCPISITGGPQADISFSSWLRLRLQQRYPDAKLEVLNVGHGGQNLERSWNYALECLDYQPDAFVLYSGNNEFLAHSILHARARLHWYSTPAAHPWMQTHLGRLWQQLLAMREERRAPHLGTLDFVEPTRMIGPALHRADDELAVYDSDRRLLGDLARRCAVHGVELFLCTLITNLADFEPSLSGMEDPPPEEEIRAWEAAIGAARKALADRSPERCIGLLDQLPESARDLAETWFRRGQALAARGDARPALACFEKARDKDGVQRRATQEYNQLIRTIAAISSARLVDIETDAYRSRSGRAPGNDWFFDHCHPTFEGTRAIVDSLEAEIVRAGCIAPQAAPPAAPQPYAKELAVIGYQPALEPVMYAAVVQSYAGLVMGRGFDPAERLRVTRELFAKVPEKYPYFRQSQLTLGCVEILAGESQAARERFAHHGIRDEEVETYVRQFVAKSRSRGIEDAFERAGILGKD